MKCPFCAHEDSQVKDSRPSEDGTAIRRRRVCTECHARFTTFERIQLRELTVIKRSGERRPFDPEKILLSLQVAVRKRAINNETIEAIVGRIVTKLESTSDGEVTTTTIGEMIMEELAKLDHVAYVRFASVYREFAEAKDFTSFIAQLVPKNHTETN